MDLRSPQLVLELKVVPFGSIFNEPNRWRGNRSYICARSHMSKIYMCDPIPALKNARSCNRGDPIALFVVIGSSCSIEAMSNRIHQLDVARAMCASSRP